MNLKKCLVVLSFILNLLYCAVFANTNNQINNAVISQEKFSVITNNLVTLSATIYNSNNQPLSSTDISSLMLAGTIWWEVSNSNVAEIIGTDVNNEQSVAYLKGKSSGIVTAYLMTTNGIADSCEVIVRNESQYENKTFNDIRGEFETMYFAGFSCLDLAPHDLNGLAEDPDLIIRQIADLKISTVILNNNIGYPDVWNDTVMDILIKKFDNYDIKVLVDDYRIRGLLSNLNDLNTYTYNTLTDYDTLKNLVNKYSDYTNVLGFYIFDEPGTNGFEALSRFTDDINEITNNKKEVYINLFPNYANGAQLAGNGNKVPDASMEIVENYYENYLLKFVAGESAVKTSILSFDHYSTYFTDAKDSNTNLFINLLNVLSASRQSKTKMIPMNYIIILEQTLGGVHYRNLNINEIAYQASVNLALGMKRIGYYACITPSNGIAVPSSALFNYNVNQTSESAVGARKSPTTEHYNMVLDINNKWAFGLGSELYNKELENVYEISSSNIFTKYASNVAEYGSIGNLTCSKNDLLISTFSDKSFQLVNNSFDDNIIVTFSNEKPLSEFEYFDFETNKWTKATNKQFSYSEKNASKVYLNIMASDNKISIAPGHSALLRPVTGKKGDMNGDGVITIIDVRLLLQFYINSQGNENIENSDMNNDGKIDIVDVRLLLQQYINEE